MVSALTILGLDDMTARYASYETLAEIICHRFIDPKDTLKELIDSIQRNWNSICEEAELNETDKGLLWGRAFLNPYSLEL